MIISYALECADLSALYLAAACRSFLLSQDSLNTNPTKAPTGRRTPKGLIHRWPSLMPVSRLLTLHRQLNQ